MNEWHYWCHTNINPALGTWPKIATFLVFMFRSSFLRKLWLCTVWRGVSVHLSVPPNNFWICWTISKSQMGSSCKAPASFMKGKGWIKESENACPTGEGEGEDVSTVLPIHVQGTKPLLHHSPSSVDWAYSLVGLETPALLPPTQMVADEHPGCFFAPKTLKEYVQSGFFRSRS